MDSTELSWQIYLGMGGGTDWERWLERLFDSRASYKSLLASVVCEWLELLYTGCHYVSVDAVPAPQDRTIVVSVGLNEPYEKGPCGPAGAGWASSRHGLALNESAVSVHPSPKVKQEMWNNSRIDKSRHEGRG